MDPAMRQNFGDAHGQIFQVIRDAVVCSHVIFQMASFYYLIKFQILYVFMTRYICEKCKKNSQNCKMHLFNLAENSNQNMQKQKTNGEEGKREGNMFLLRILCICSNYTIYLFKFVNRFLVISKYISLNQKTFKQNTNGKEGRGRVELVFFCAFFVFVKITQYNCSNLTVHFWKY